MIRKLLIANRGEIACRIARTARRLGISVATVHSEADRGALHVRDIGESILIGAAPASQSYLNAAALLDAAAQVGADAVHPGIGFLSEDPLFAEAVEAKGMIFVGPRPETMRRFGDKWAAKHEARQAKVSVIGGSEGSSSDAAAVERTIRDEMSLPVVLKAAAGGGGRGVRIVRTLDGLTGAIESAMREAQSSFGRPDLIIEEFVENARHLEVQVAGDGSGAAIHLFERECSLQRRFQKIIEEAPSTNVSPQVRERILTDAVNLARRVNYRNLGTMEFLVVGDRHYFLECNPRLQVEHTVTEEVTGLDLVELQLTIASDGRLPLTQSRVALRGHAIQARVYAEDASAGFLPSTGPLQYVEFPAGLRIETGVESGSEITPFYDPMIAKLVARGENRAQALDKLLLAVGRTVVFGVETNLEFLRILLTHPEVLLGTPDNRFIDRELSQLLPSSSPSDPESVAVAAALLLRRWNMPDDNLGLWSGGAELLGWQYQDGSNLASAVPTLSFADDHGRSHDVSVIHASADGICLLVDNTEITVDARSADGTHWQVALARREFGVVAHVDRDSVKLHGPFGSRVYTIVPFLSLETTTSVQGGQVCAPMMGAIAKIKIKVGDMVENGDVVLVQESMKMEMNMSAPCSGRVAAIHCAEGDMVERNQILVEISPDE